MAENKKVNPKDIEYKQAIWFLDCLQATKYSGDPSLHIAKGLNAAETYGGLFPESTTKGKRTMLINFFPGDIDRITTPTGTFRSVIDKYARMFKLDPCCVYACLRLETLQAVGWQNVDKTGKDPRAFTKYCIKTAGVGGISKAHGRMGTFLNSSDCTGLAQIQVVYARSADNTSLTDALSTTRWNDTYTDSGYDDITAITNTKTEINTRLNSLISKLEYYMDNNSLSVGVNPSGIVEFWKDFKDNLDTQAVVKGLKELISSLYGSDIDVVFEGGIYKLKVPYFGIFYRNFYYSEKQPTSEYKNIIKKTLARSIALSLDTDASVFITCSLLRDKMNTHVHAVKQHEKYLAKGGEKQTKVKDTKDSVVLTNKFPSAKYESDPTKIAAKKYYTDELLMSGVYRYLGTGAGDKNGTTPKKYVSIINSKLIDYKAYVESGSSVLKFPSGTVDFKDLEYVSNSTGASTLDFTENGTINSGDNNEVVVPLKPADLTVENAIDSMVEKWWKNGESKLEDIDFQVMKDKEMVAALKIFYNNAMNVTPVNLAGIIGLPPRFPELVDPRLNSAAVDKFGLKVGDGEENVYEDIYGPMFTKLYMSAGHIVTLTPGVPEFMVGFSDKDREAVTITYTDETASGNEVNKENMAALREKTKTARAGGTLFGFKPAWEKYTHIVKNLNYVTAQFFGVTDYEWYHMLDDNEREAIFGNTPAPAKDSKTLTHKYFDPIRLDMNKKMIFSMIDSAGVDASNADNNANISMYNTYIYNNGPMAMSEDVSNNTGPSVLNQLLGMTPNEQVKDLNFLTNGLASNSSKEALSWVGKSNIFKNLTADNGVFGKATMGVFGIGNVASAIAGAQIKLPDVFKDSSYNKTFEIKMKLTSPSPDKISFFKYIMCEFNRIMPYVLPQQFGAFVDAQLAPFIIQVYSKGLVACELGMITGMGINRNPETMSLNKYPTEIDITLTVKDLSPMLSIPNNPNDIAAKFDRTYISSGIVPYLATYAGIPLYRSDNLNFFTRKFAKLVNVGESIRSTPEKAITAAAQHQYTKLMRALGR